MGKGLSKSRYTISCKCQKALWLKVNKPELGIEKAADAFIEGNEVGDLAMGLFGPYVDVTVYAGGNLDLQSMIQRTNDCLKNGTENICEASFSFNETVSGMHYCAVDILRKNGDGYDIYEVKSSTCDPNDKDTENALRKYTIDIAYQKWVLEKCGIKVKDCYLVRLSKLFVRNGAVDIKDLFHITSMNAYVSNEFPNIENNVKQAFDTLASTTEPNVAIGPHCKTPYECAFKEYCFKDVPNPSVLNLYGKFDKWKLWNSGKKVYSDLDGSDLGNDGKEKNIRLLQVGGKPLINKNGISDFLKKVTYPLYYLDFETMKFAVPPYDGLKPYQQIPFQYSLHIQEKEGGVVIHKEFLAESGTDPRKALAEQLCKDIPQEDICVLVYNDTFEKNRLKELADTFPSLKVHLLHIDNHIVDLYEPFGNGYFYLPQMGGSFSIKSVLPALFPNDPSLDYHNLSGCVKNGGDAMDIFPKIKDMREPEKTQTREALLKYCELDTWAMVKIVETLYKV